jgi:hypothetical protein
MSGWCSASIRKYRDAYNPNKSFSMLIKKKGDVRTIESLGRGRSVADCTQNVLSFYSAAGIKKTSFKNPEEVSSPGEEQSRICERAKGCIEHACIHDKDTEQHQ